MSHRRAATDADRYFDALKSRYGRMRLPNGAIDMTSDVAMMTVGMCDVPDSAIRDMSGVEYMLGLRRKPGAVSVHDLSLWSRWRTCRHVYRFDRDLSRELCETKLPDAMPLESLLMMPYPIVYIDATMPAVGATATGAFVWLEDVEEGRSLNTCMLLDDGCVQANTLRLYKGTLGDAVESSVRYDADFAARLGMRWMTLDAIVGGSFREMSRRMYAAVLNHVLYIVSDAKDQRVEYRPSSGAAGGGRGRRKGTQSTIHAVGEVAGRALGAARVSYASDATKDGTGSGKRPHVRAAHYHHYWTGPKSEPESRKLVLHWIPPIFVGGGSDDAPTTVHRS